MTIRQAVEKDAADLSQLLGQLSYPAAPDEVLKRILLHQQSDYRLFVAEVDGRCIGFVALHWYAAFHHPRPVGRIVAFCVNEIHRGKGYGLQLLAFAEDFFRQRNCLKVELTSNLRRKESHEYYLRRGYEQQSMHLVKYLIH